MKKIIEHYDTLIEENNDPVYDPFPLKEYMDKWDGQIFIDSLQLSPNKDVLEIGVGTGRLALRVCGECNTFYGIDISPKTIERTTENLKHFDNCTFICADFMEYQFNKSFDVIYSSLAFIHISNKRMAIEKTARLLKANGIFVLSISKSQDKYLEMNNTKLDLFPAMPEEIKEMFNELGLALKDFFETEFAFVFIGIQRPK
ncbi:MAG: class I SAM-dependent methyltransferase [Oscillospiraceae bacterium]|jgi:ubiquinone/menaquinone biosynthesis C-methylase UbiE|nr:class I SAM-dependent methyltransferase [Oscillospiraceae bacterium]